MFLGGSLDGEAPASKLTQVVSRNHFIVATGLITSNILLSARGPASAPRGFPWFPTTWLSSQEVHNMAAYFGRGAGACSPGGRVSHTAVPWLPALAFRPSPKRSNSSLSKNAGVRSLRQRSSRSPKSRGRGGRLDTPRSLLSTPPHCPGRQEARPEEKDEDAGPRPSSSCPAPRPA